MLIFLVHTVKAHGGSRLQLHSFLTSAIDGCEWATSRPGLCTCPPPGKAAHSGRFGDEKTLVPADIRNPDSPTFSTVTKPTEISRLPQSV
jgi:hypothetical protein